jgi:hypothetical protein
MERALQVILEEMVDRQVLIPTLAAEVVAAEQPSFS